MLRDSLQFVLLHTNAIHMCSQVLGILLLHPSKCTCI